MSSTCPVCRAPGSPTRMRVVTDRPYRVHRCRSCGLAYTEPRLAEAELGDFYERTYFEGESGFGYTDYGGESWADANAARTWADLSDWLPGAGPRSSPPRVLDIGCAFGGLLRAARADGWEVVGMDASETARAHARTHGLPVVGSLDDAALAAGTFDLVTMFHVVEHLTDPVAALRRAREVVLGDGFVVIEVPQWRSLGRLVRRERWAQLRPPEHINFFDRRSLVAALSMADLRPVRSETPYPHLHDRWAAASGPAKRLRAAPGLLAAVTAERLSLGGYLRCLATPA